MRNLKSRRSLVISVVGLLALLSMALGSLYFRAGASKAASPAFVTLPNSAARWIGSSSAHLVGPHAANDRMTVALLLRNSNSAEQNSLLKSLYHPNSPSYHHWLTSGQYNALFAPSVAEVAAAQRFLTSAGLTLMASPSETLVEATGTMSQVEAAFHTQINDYRLPTGTYYANSANVQVPSSMSAGVLGVFGLSNVPVATSDDVIARGKKPNVAPPPYGGGPSGSGLTPSQIAGIYDASPVYSKLQDQGQGTTIAVYELAGYKSSDITQYEQQYKLPNVKLVNIPVLGGATTDNGAAEVELDIELQIALAPQVKQLLVYEAPNTELGALSEYFQMARDNQADAISTSWGIICEFFVNSQITLAENQIFLQMAFQGQSIFAASGDAGAYGCSRVGYVPPGGQELQIGDPNNQPYITAVGGTSFRQPNQGTVNFNPGSNPNPTYPGTSKEGTWLEACTTASCEGSGGGVSRFWAEPDYAANLTTGQYYPGVVEASSQGGSYCGQQPGVLCRENPDVSLDADPGTGYSIYCTDAGDSFCATGEFGKPGWIRLGGTSCAAPLWAAIAALDITYHNHARLGLFNYIVYPFDSTSGYANQFHDITLYTNGFYAAGKGYDMATGVGTPDIYNLIK